MFKRILVIGALVMGFVSMAVTKVAAITIGGYKTRGTNSVEIESVLKQLQNADATKPAYEVLLFLQQVSIQCKNPAGQSEEANNGQPFNQDIVVGETQTAQDLVITKNGRALSDIVFPDAELLGAVLASLGIVCKNNWSPDKIVVDKMQVFGTAFSCALQGDPENPRGTPPCGIEDALGKKCVVPSDLSRQQLFSNITYEYVCNTLCDDPDPQTRVCPQPPGPIP